MFYTYYKGDIKKAGIKRKPSFTHQGVSYFLVEFKMKNATISVTDFPSNVIGKRTFM